MKSLIDDLYGFCINQLNNSKLTEFFLLVALSEHHRGCSNNPRSSIL